jgi:hypothetical protein
LIIEKENHGPDRTRRAWETHLIRAQWMTTNGYRHLLAGGVELIAFSLSASTEDTKEFS